MAIKDITKWNKRFAIVYAIGVWSMLGSFGIYKYMGYYDVNDKTVKEVVKEPENKNKVVYKTGHMETTVVYKEDFVPYTTRVYNFFKSFSKRTGTRDSEE